MFDRGKITLLIINPKGGIEMRLLFVTTFCPKCKPEKKKAKDMDNCKVIFADTPEGLKLAKKYNVTSVPTWVDVDE